MSAPERNPRGAFWAEHLALANRTFHLTPAQFWALSVWEWRALLRALDPAPGMDRASLQDLMAQFPDDVTTQNKPNQEAKEPDHARSHPEGD